MKNVITENFKEKDIRDLLIHFAEEKDIQLVSMLIALTAEYELACKKHPEWPKDIIHQAAIVAEESGELVQASLQNEYEQGKEEWITKEAIQTGAMALRLLIENMDKKQTG